MNRLVMYFVAVLLTIGCSSTPNTAVNTPVSEIQKDYVVRDRNPDVVPDWMRDFTKFRRETEGKGHSYFLGHSRDVSDRTAGCDVAEADAKKRISHQIATLISDKLAASKSGQLFVDKNNPDDPGLRRHFEETLAQKSVAFLSGVQYYSTFWEERDYSISGGRKSVFTCSSVAMIDDKSLNEAIRRATQKAPEVVEDPQAKSAVKDALKDVDSLFRSYSSTQN